MNVARLISTRRRHGLASALILGLAVTLMPLTTSPAHADIVAPSYGVRAIEFDDQDCGPPSTTIPGPPPELIVVGQPMSDSWLMCYIKRDFEGQTYFFDRWGEAHHAAFRGYPVECWNEEVDPALGGEMTPGIVAQIYGWNLDRTQYVRFTYRIQNDGDYINNCHQEVLPTP